jgi:hypothetical protein
MSELKDIKDMVCLFEGTDESALYKNLSNEKIIDLIGKRLSERHRDWVMESFEE